MNFLFGVLLLCIHLLICIYYGIRIVRKPSGLPLYLLTVRRGNAADNTDYSWEEVNRYSVSDYMEMGVERYGVEAILQIGDDNGPIPGELGYNEMIPNAIVNIRGATSSNHVQKSYKISLMESTQVYIMIVHYMGDDISDEIKRIIHKTKYQIKSKTMRGETSEMAIEVLVRNNNFAFAEHIRNLERVNDLTVIQGHL